MVSLTPEICRAARALLAIAQRDLGQRSGVSHPTIATFEMGDRRPYARTLRDLVAAFEAAGVVFIEPQPGVHKLGIALKWDVEPPKVGKAKGAEVSSEGEQDVLDALDLASWEIDTPEDLEPFERTAEERAAMLAYWRARPEKWAALADISRVCLLRAMEIDRL